MKKALYTMDPELAVYGLAELVAFVMDMHEENGGRNCGILSGKNSNWKDVNKLVKMVQNDPEDNTGYLDVNEETGAILFNGQDVTDDVSWMVESYMKNDFKKLGYFFGETMDKTLRPKK